MKKLILIIAIVFYGMLFVAGCTKDETEVPIHHNQRFLKFAYNLSDDNTIDSAFILGDTIIPKNIPHQLTSNSTILDSLTFMWVNIETNKMYYILDSVSGADTITWCTNVDYYIERYK